MFGKKKKTTDTPVAIEQPLPIAKFEIGKLGYLDLKELRDKIDDLIQNQFAEARDSFRRDFLDKMSEFGMSLDDFKQPKVKKERKKRDLPIKYRDPENPGNTWTGMGKPKKWLQEKLDQGHSLEEFAVDTESRDERIG